MSSWTRLKMDYRNSYRQSIISHWVANFMGDSGHLDYTRGEYPHPMPMVEDQLTYIMSLLEKRQQAMMECEKLERLFEKNNLHPRTTGKDISHLTMKLGLAHVAVTGYNFMIEHYVLKMVKKCLLNHVSLRLLSGKLLVIWYIRIACLETYLKIQY